LLLLRREIDVAQLEFRQVIGGPRLTTIPTTDAVTIPEVGDIVFVPEAEDPGVYAQVRIKDRHFYYDQRGQLTVVCLACEVLVSEPAGQEGPSRVTGDR
jgi:hypothetical protein